VQGTPLEETTKKKKQFIRKEKREKVFEIEGGKKKNQAGNGKSRRHTKKGVGPEV